MMNADMERRIRSHRMAGDMSLLDLQRVHNRDDVGARDILTVSFRRLRHVRRRIAARSKRNAVMRAGEMPYLGFPCAVIPRKLMNEDNRRTTSRFFVVQADAVCCGVGCHRKS